MTCDYDVAVRVVAANGSTVRIDLNDRADGFTVETLQEPDDNVRDVRASAPRVDGSFRVAEADDDGTFVVVMHVDGATWAEVETRWQTVRAAYRAESQFYLETEVEGVTKRWRTERPDVSPGGIESLSLYLKRQTYSLRFRVQPNPSVSA